MFWPMAYVLSGRHNGVGGRGVDRNPCDPWPRGCHLPGFCVQGQWTVSKFKGKGNIVIHNI